MALGDERADPGCNIPKGRVRKQNVVVLIRGGPLYPSLSVLAK